MENRIEKALELLTKKPYLVTMGANTVARRYGYSRQEITEAKKLFYKRRALKRGPRILIFDIETSPMKAYVWKRWKENISLDQTISEWFMICWAAKWLGEEEVYSSCLTPSEITEEDDKRITEELWKLLDEADIVVGHNCLEKHTKILKTDLTWVEAGALKVGDKLVGFEEEHFPNKPRQIKEAIVTENTIIKKKALKVTLSDGTSIIATPEHKWLKLSEKGRDYQWCETQYLKVGQRVERFLNPWVQDTSYEAGWLSGFISGEGTLKGSDYRGSSWSVSSIDFCQRPTKVLDQALEYCDKLNIDIAPLQSKNGGLGKGDTLYTYTLGGKFKTLEYLGKLRINRLIDKIDWNRFGSLKSQSSETLSIVSIEDAGEQEICILGTSTNTYIAEGFAMHNCKKFDIPKMNSRFILNGLPPCSPYKQIDTCEVSKKSFGFSSSKLDALATYFGFPNKDKTDFNLWKACLEGNQKALEYMAKYNIKDVAILEKVYIKLRSWIPNHPNAGLYIESDKPVCPICGSTHMELTSDFKYTHTSKFKVMRCTDCGGIARIRNNAYPKDKKNSLVLSV